MIGGVLEEAVHAALVGGQAEVPPHHGGPGLGRLLHVRAGRAAIRLNVPAATWMGLALRKDVMVSLQLRCCTFAVACFVEEENQTTITSLRDLHFR